MFYLYRSSIIGDPVSDNIGLCELCPSTNITTSQMECLQFVLKHCENLKYFNPFPQISKLAQTKCYNFAIPKICPILSVYQSTKNREVFTPNN